MPVIDASVYVALINAQEEAHTQCWAWYEGVQATEEAIVAPAILLPEVGAAISRGVGSKELALQVVEQLKDAGVIELFPVTQMVAEQAAQVASENQIRGCDAIYVALAEQLTDELVTLDRQQLERASSIVKVRKP